MRFGRDVVSGFGLSLCSLAVGLAAIPFYIRYLGIEAYGLIGFFVTLQAVFQFLDFGLSPAINREVAQAQASGRDAELPGLFRSLEVVFLGTATLIVVTIAAAAPLLASQWLKPETLSPAVVERSVGLIGMTIACRWPVGLYLGVLMGARRITLANNLAIAATMAGSVGAILTLALVSPTLDAFFVWQAIVGLVQVIIMRVVAWRIIGPPTQPFSFQPLKSIWRFSLTMTGVAISGVLFTQLDKIILSRLLPLSQFGHYALATTLAATLYRIVGPVYNAVYPRFSALVAAADTGALADIYRIASSILASMLFPAAVVLTVFGNSLVALWTGDSSLAAQIAPLVGILAIGSALHGVMYMPYALQLAYGDTALPLRINLLLMVVQVPLTIFLSVKFGAVGGAAAWLVLHVLYLALGTWLTHRRLLPDARNLWLTVDIGVPLLASAMVGLAAWFIVRAASPSPLAGLVGAAITGILAVAVSVGLQPHSLRHTRAVLSR